MFYGIYLIFIKCFGVFISGKSISLRHFKDRDYAIQQGISHSFLRHSVCLFRLQTRDEGRELETHFRAIHREGMPEIRRPLHASGQCPLRHRDPYAQLFLHRPGRDNESIYSNEDMTSSFHDTILKGLRGSLQMKPYKDEGITFCYDYYSISSGKKLFNLTFTPEDYN